MYVKGQGKMQSISIISFNSVPEKSLKWLSKCIHTENPYIALFQGVTNQTVMPIIAKLRKYSYQYKVSNDKRKVYEIIACKRPIVDSIFKRFSTSKTGKGILWANILIDDQTITLASTSLEQGDELIGMGQLDCITEFFDKQGQTIIACDTGFKGKYETEWNDAWHSAGKNSLAQYTVEDGSLRYRPDRIYYNGFDDPTFELLSRTEKLPHFPIKLTLQIPHNG